MPSGPAFPQAFTSAATVNGIIYVVGGTNNLGIITGAVQAYDPATDSWTTVSSMPTARSDIALGTVNGALYAFGGSAGGSTFLQTVEELVLGRTLYAHRKN
jgi:N-acetylneuraminic acid mutarotase